MTKEQKEQKLVPNWQVTATTIYCEAVKNEATIMVYKDWSTACAYYKRWGPVQREKRKGIGALLVWLGILPEEKRTPARECPGPEKCPQILEYRDKLYREEEELMRRTPVVS